MNELFGNSIFCFDDIYSRVFPFIQAWKFYSSSSSSMDKKIPLYFVAADVKTSFDTIEQAKLFEIVQKNVFSKVISKKNVALMSQEEYGIIKYCLIMNNPNKEINIIHKRVA